METGADSAEGTKNTVGRRSLLAGAAAGTALLATGLAGRPAFAQMTRDAVTAARFSITIDGFEIASFSELQGIVTEVVPVDPASTTDETVLKKLPGKRVPPTVTLKRGMDNSLELWAWHEAVVLGDIVAARKSCSLVMYAADGKPVARYHLEQAWPSKIEVGALKAGSSTVLMETVTLVAEQLQRVAP